jgi:hypothetical protein
LIEEGLKISPLRGGEESGRQEEEDWKQEKSSGARR